MDYITSSEIAARWGITDTVVRRYCRGQRIKNAFQKDGIWYIPANAERPERKKYEAAKTAPPAKFLLKIIRQRDSTNYSGLYDYMQINMAYCNCRMASNRLTREQVESLYKTDKITFLNEALRINDLIETRNQFRCFDFMLDRAMAPLTQIMIQKLHVLTLADSWHQQAHQPHHHLCGRERIREEAE